MQNPGYWCSGNGDDIQARATSLNNGQVQTKCPACTRAGMSIGGILLETGGIEAGLESVKGGLGEDVIGNKDLLLFMPAVHFV